jgi:hypothetical protein
MGILLFTNYPDKGTIYSHIMNIDFNSYIQKSISFEQYNDLIHQLLNDNKTTGSDQSQGMIDYTRLNEQRNRRIMNTGVLQDATLQILQGLTQAQHWLVISEAWCGDAAQNLAWIHKMANAAPNVQLHIVLRDENIELIDAFLTRGGRAIPKVIMLNDKMEILNVWGPRPEEAQKIVLAHKENPTETKEEMYKRLHVWYSMNKGSAIQQEFIALLKP